MKTSARDKAWATEIRRKEQARNEARADALKVERAVEKFGRKREPVDTKVPVYVGVDWGMPTELDKHVRTALRCTTPAIIRDA